MSISKKSEKTTQSMDFFAEAVIQLYQEKSINFEFEFEINGQKIREKHDLSRYLRKDYKEYLTIEQKLFELVSGDILDIGSGTGNYLNLMKEKSKSVLGLELSSKLVEFGKELFDGDLICADFFEYDFDEQKFDTITLLENNIGICQAPERLIKMIDIFNDILNTNGQILIVAKKYDKTFSSNHYHQVILTPYLDNQKGESFTWITFNENYLEEIFQKNGYTTKQILEENGNLLLEIKKNN